MRRLLTALVLASGVITPQPINGSRIQFIASGTGATTRSIQSKLRDTISVKDFGALGDGVADDTAAIQAARDAAASSGQGVSFPQGTYKYTASPNWAVQGMRLIGIGKVILQFNGTGNAVVFDAGAVSGNIYDVGMENFTISGTATATNGLFLRGVHHSYFKQIRVTAISAACLLTNFAVVNTYDTFRCSVNEGAFGTTPVNGMLFDRRGAGENSTASEVIDPIIEGVSGSGIKLVNANNVHVLSGTSEANARGIEIGSGSTRNAFENIDLEANTVEDALVQGSDNQFLNLLSVSTGALGVLHFNGTGAVRNLVNGGTFNNIALDTGTVANSLIRVGYNFLGTGAITDNGTNTVKIGNINIASNTSDATVIPQGSFNGAAGSVTTPTYSFNSEPSAGLYRAALNDLRIGIGGGDVFKWLATGPVVPSSFGLVLGSTNQASLASVGGILNGMMIYCSDCTIANPCAGGGAGAFAQRTNGAWVCDGGPASAGSEHDFGAYNSANLGATTALSETIVTNASTTTAASKITTDIAGVGAGNFVAMLCTDGTACAAGNQRLTCTQACTAVAGTRTACTVQNGGTIAAGTTVTWSVTTACATTDPGVNINAHLTTP